MSTLFTTFQPGESSSEEQVINYIQCSDLAAFKRRKLKQNIGVVVSYWCRILLKQYSNSTQIHAKVLIYCIEPNVFKLCWSSQHHKSSLIELSNKDKTAMIHQKSFRRKRKKEIDFDQLR